MKKKVFAIFILAIIGVFLIAMIFFGERKITSFAVFNRGEEITQNGENVFFNKEVVLSKTEGGSYVSDVFDVGANSSIRGFESGEEEFRGRLLYNFDENGELRVSADEGLTWSLVDEPAKIEKMKSAVKKGDLIEDYSIQWEIEARACFREDCSDGEFVSVKGAQSLRGRYFQYRARLENAGEFKVPESISAKVSYMGAAEGPQANEDLREEETALEDPGINFSDENISGGIINDG